MIGLLYEHERRFVFCVASFLIYVAIFIKFYIFNQCIAALSFVNICARCFFCFKTVFCLVIRFFKVV